MRVEHSPPLGLVPMPRAEASTPARPHRHGDAAAGRTPRAGMRTEPQAPAGGARAGRHNILYGIGGPVPGHQNKMSGLGHHNFVVHRQGPFQRAGVFFVRTGVESVKLEGEGGPSGREDRRRSWSKFWCVLPSYAKVSYSDRDSRSPLRGACPPRAARFRGASAALRCAACVGFQ